MVAIALALGSSLVYGMSDFLGGLKSRSLPLLWVLLISQGSALVVLALIVLGSGEGPPSGAYVGYAVLAGLSEAVGVAALYRGLAVGVMSIVAPVAATAPVVPVVVAIFLGELPAPIQGGGIVLALAGIAVISWGTHPEEQPPVRCPPGEIPAPHRAGFRISPEVGTSILFGFLTALGFGGFLVGMDAASEGSVPWALLVARLASVGAFINAYLVTRPPLAVGRDELPVLALIGLLIIGADSLYAVASTEGLLSVVVVLSSLYPAVTIALARVFLHRATPATPAGRGGGRPVRRRGYRRRVGLRSIVAARALEEAEDSVRFREQANRGREQPGSLISSTAAVRCSTAAGAPRRSSADPSWSSTPASPRAAEAPPAPA